jgi:hypothetical protein
MEQITMLLKELGSKYEDDLESIDNIIKNYFSQNLPKQINSLLPKFSTDLAELFNKEFEHDSERILNILNNYFSTNGQEQVNIMLSKLYPELTELLNQEVRNLNK